MTLPEELKNKVVWAAFIAELAEEQGDSEWLNVSVVASFLEAKRKELEKLAVERRQVALAEYTDLKEFRTWKKELWVNLPDALAVFGEERK